MGVCGHRVRKPGRQLELWSITKRPSAAESGKLPSPRFNSESLFDRRFDKKIQIRGSVSVCATVNTLSETSERADDQVLYCSEASVGFCSLWERPGVRGGKCYFRSKNPVYLNICVCSFKLCNVNAWEKGPDSGVFRLTVCV